MTRPLAEHSLTALRDAFCAVLRRAQARRLAAGLLLDACTAAVLRDLDARSAGGRDARPTIVAVCVKCNDPVYADEPRVRTSLGTLHKRHTARRVGPGKEPPCAS
jgi:hypothetical protein